MDIRESGFCSGDQRGSPLRLNCRQLLTCPLLPLLLPFFSPFALLFPFSFLICQLSEHLNFVQNHGLTNGWSWWVFWYKLRDTLPETHNIWEKMGISQEDEKKMTRERVQKHHFLVQKCNWIIWQWKSYLWHNLYVLKLNHERMLFPILDLNVPLKFDTFNIHF